MYIIFEKMPAKRSCQKNVGEGSFANPLPTEMLR